MPSLAAPRQLHDTDIFSHHQQKVCDNGCLHRACRWLRSWCRAWTEISELLGVASSAAASTGSCVISSWERPCPWTTSKQWWWTQCLLTVRCIDEWVTREEWITNRQTPIHAESDAVYVSSPPDTVDIEQVMTRIDDIVSSNQPVSSLPSYGPDDPAKVRRGRVCICHHSLPEEALEGGSPLF